jgi:hypothetical protein
MNKLAIVSTSTLRAALRLPERANLASLRPHVINLRLELFNREHEGDANLTTWVEQGMAA